MTGFLLKYFDCFTVKVLIIYSPPGKKKNTCIFQSLPRLALLPLSFLSRSPLCVRTCFCYNSTCPSPPLILNPPHGSVCQHQPYPESPQISIHPSVCLLGMSWYVISRSLRQTLFDTRGLIQCQVVKKKRFLNKSSFIKTLEIIATYIFLKNRHV